MLRFFIQYIHGPAGHFPIALIAILMGKRAPIHQIVVTARCLTDDFFIRDWYDVGPRAQNIELAIGIPPAESAMVDFTGTVIGIAVLGKVLGKGNQILQGIDIPNPRRETVNAGGGRSAIPLGCWFSKDCKSAIARGRC